MATNETTTTIVTETASSSSRRSGKKKTDEVSPYKTLFEGTRSNEGTTIEKLEAYKKKVAREKKQREEAKKRRREEREREKEEKKKWKEENEKKRQARLAIDKKKNDLIDKAAIKYWNKHFGKDTLIVTNAEFAAKLKPYLLKKKWMYDNNKERLLFDEKNKDVKSNQIDQFIELCCDKFFLLPNPEKYPQSKPSEGFVSQDAVQCLIHIFGPWIQIFEMIKVHFFDRDDRTNPRPIEVWHARITKEKAEELLRKGDERKSSRKQRFLLRLGTADGEEGKIFMSNIRRTRRGTRILKHEPLERKMPGKIYIVNWNKRRTGKTKPIPPKWTYIEALPSAGGMRDNYTHYTNMTNFLISMKGNNTVDTRNKCAGPAKIRTPVYAPGYGPEVKDGDESSDVKSPEPYKEPVYEEDDGDATPEDMLDKFTDDEGMENQKENTKES